MTSGPEAAAGSSCFRAALLDGDVAFITGGSSGINLAIARRFLELGARVVLVARDRARLERARAALGWVRRGDALTRSTANIPAPTARSLA